MNVIFMGKSKNSTCEALNYLLTKGHNVVYAIIPNEESELKKICERNKIETKTYSELILIIERKQMKIEEIDYVISFLFWEKIKEPLLSLGKKGCVNFHPAPLPDYRGMAGYSFSIIDEIDYWGVSLHFVDEEIDTGNIIECIKFPIDSKKITVMELEQKTQKKLLELFFNFVDNINNENILEAKKQNKERGKYISKKYLESSKEVFFTDSKEVIDKKIRAFWFPPYDGAYIKINDEKYTLINHKMLKKIAEKKE
ncbi:MAG: formyltransferase family protein [Fusobacteriaceae bacterium]